MLEEKYNPQYKEANFLGRGTVTVSQIFYTSPSRCAVADSCSISLDRRMTAGETWESCLEEIRNLPNVKKYGAEEFISYKNGTIDEQVLKMTNGKGVDKVIIAGGGVETFAEAVRSLKPGGKIGNVNYLGKGDYIQIPRAEWGVGMGHKAILGGLMPGGRLRMEKLGALVSSGKLNVHHLVSHVFNGWENLEKALFMMRDKPADLIKPVVRIEK